MTNLTLSLHTLNFNSGGYSVNLETEFFPYLKNKGKLHLYVSLPYYKSDSR